LVDNDVSLAQTMLVVYSLGWSLKPLYAFAIQKIRRQRDKYTRRLLIALVVLSGSVTFFSANMVATASDVTTFGVYMFLVYGGLAGLESIVDGYICRAVKRLDACNQFHGKQKSHRHLVAN
jgi:O-antigen ligase